MKNLINTKRINLTLKEDLIKLIKLLAYNDNVSPTTKALELLKKGLELEEDTILVNIAEERLKEKGNILSSKDFWEKAIKD